MGGGVQGVFVNLKAFFTAFFSASAFFFSAAALPSGVASFSAALFSASAFFFSAAA